jgi:hypothetical protein
VKNLGLILKFDVDVHPGALDCGKNLIERVEFVGFHSFLKFGLRLLNFVLALEASADGAFLLM